MLGSEAIARGAWEAGVVVGCTYPGTVCSGIMAALSKYPEVYTEWVLNQKAAIEAAHSTALAGERALACIRHVDLNIAADLFLDISYTGVEGGLVIVVEDNPGQHTPKSKQDSRNWTRFAKVPMLEPANAEECRAFTKIAFQISEAFHTPVLLKTDARVFYVDSPVKQEERITPYPKRGSTKKDIPQYVMVPTQSRQKGLAIEDRAEGLAHYAETAFPYNIMEINDLTTGFITSGIIYTYAKEAFNGCSYLKLGMVWPLPERMIREFFQMAKRVIVVEEMDPFLETELRARGFRVCHGKDLIASQGELSPEILQDALIRFVNGGPYKERLQYHKAFN
jgi:indolepyruvate ferredoxin oxidoreductase alpha subunit